jgi:hypothetical protein
MIQLAPYGTAESRYMVDWKAAPKRDRALLNALRAKHGKGMIEVYGIIYDPNKPKPAIFDRQYNLLGFVSLEQAEALLAEAVVTSDWEGYALGGVQGYTVWIAHPESSDGSKAVDHNLLSKAFSERPRP